MVMAACSSLVLAAALLVAAGHAGLPAAATAYIVGDSNGWAIGNNYTTWASKNKFMVGDKLVFSYVTQAHTVAEVAESGYDTCSGGSKPLSSDDSGSTTVSLDTPGAHYFICTVTGHCASGMKLSVTVAAPSTAGSSLVPAMGSAVAAATGALIKLVLL